MMRRIILLLLFCFFAVSSNTAAQNTPKELATARALFANKIAKLKCGPPIPDFENWSGFPVRKCKYSDVGITTESYMLNPSEDQLAAWTVTACHDVGATHMNACIHKLTHLIHDASSGGVFPVSGFIVEPASSAGGKGNGPVCLLFRDGVTIKTKTWNTRAPVNNVCGTEDELKNPAKGAKRFARVISTTRQEYRDAGGSEEVGTDKNQDIRWLTVVRTLYQQAWNSDRNQLITAKAKDEKALGHIK
jgi:hypothetical protein